MLVVKIDGHNQMVDCWFPDGAVLDRIIEAVGFELKSSRDQLVSDLLEVHTEWLVVTALDSKKGAHARRKLFDAVAQSAKKFKKHLLDPTGERYAARAILSTFSNASDFDAFLDGLSYIIQVAEIFVQQNKDGWVRLNRSQKDWFVAEILPSVYEDNFGRKARRSTGGPLQANAGAAGGPCVRFAVAVVREMMGIEMSPETVARAMKDVKARIGRRKLQAPIRHRRQGRREAVPLR